MSETPNFKPENFDKNCNYVIEASAGTGKTYNIIEILKNLTKNDNDNRFNEEKLSHILVVTYTEKATQELKNRIRKDLKVNIENASIFTIHSFCKSVIDNYPLSSLLPTNLTMMSEDQLDDFINDYIRKGDIFKEYNDLLKWLNIKESKLDSLFEAIKNSLKCYYLDSSFSEDLNIISIDSDRFLQIDFGNFRGAQNVKDLPSQFSKFKEQYDILKAEENNNPKINGFLNELVPNNLFNYNSTSYKVSSMKTEETKKALSFFKSIKDQLNKNTFTNFISYLTIKYIKDVYQSLDDYKRQNKLQTFDDMIRNVREEILKPNSELKIKLQEKYKYGIIDEFQDTNQKQFDVFSKIFLEDNSHHLIVVGDPKQSIYGFQGSDLNVYNKAKNIISNNGKLESLTTNYRSTKRMVESCNKLFKEFSPLIYTKKKDGKEIECEIKDTVFENFKESNSKEDYSSKFQDKENKAFWIIEEVDEYEYAKAVCEQIVECCLKDSQNKTKLQIQPKGEELRNVTFKDFTILYRTRSESYPIINELKRLGIPYQISGECSLFKGNEAYAIKTLFEAIDCSDFTGNNRKVFKKSLLTPFFGLKPAEIKNKKYDNNDSIEMSTIIKYKEIANNKNYEDLIDSMLYESKLINSLKSINDIQTLGIYKQIGSFCIDYLSKNHTIKDLISKLNTLNSSNDKDSDSDNENSEEDFTIIEKTTDFNAVNLCTIHSSKGLQYPVVVVVGGFKQANKKSCFIKHDKNTDKNLLFRYVYDEYKEDDIQEVQRLFYVCYTRAQYVLMLPRYIKYGYKFIGDSLKRYIDNNSEDFRKFYESTDKHLSEKVKQILADYSKEESNSNSETDPNKQKEINKSLIDDKGNRLTYKHSYSSLSHPKNKDNDISIEDEVNKEGEENNSEEFNLSSFDKNSKQITGNLTKDTSDKLFNEHIDFIRGTEIGTALHEVFEKTDFTDTSNLENTIDITLNKYSLHLSDNDKDYIKEIVNHVLNGDFIEIIGSKESGKTFKLSELKLNDRKNEIEFNFDMENLDNKLDKYFIRNYCNGFMDLLFKRNVDGVDVYSILDYKSDSLKEDFLSYEDNNELKKHTDSHYSIQRVLYSYCLINYLSQFYKDLTKEEIFNRHFGGIYYVYIKGCYKDTKNGIYAQTWNSYSELEWSYKNIKGRIYGNK